MLYLLPNSLRLALYSVYMCTYCSIRFHITILSTLTRDSHSLILLLHPTWPLRLCHLKLSEKHETRHAHKSKCYFIKNIKTMNEHSNNKLQIDSSKWLWNKWPTTGLKSIAALHPLMKKAWWLITLKIPSKHTCACHVMGYSAGKWPRRDWNR